MTISKNTSNVALLTVISTFILAASLVLRYDFSKLGFQLLEKRDIFNNEFKIEHAVGVEAVSLIFIMINSFLSMLCVFSLRDKNKEKHKEYIVSILLATAIGNGMFSSLNIMLFNVFFFILPIPFIFISRINMEEEDNTKEKWPVLNLLLSSFLFLTAVVCYLFNKETGDCNINRLTFILIAASLFLRLGFVPNHFWLAGFLRKLEAPVASFFLTCQIMSFVYVVLHFVMPLLPKVCVEYGNIIVIMASITTVYCSICVVLERNTFRFLSYLFGIYLGIVTIGLFSFDALLMASVIFIFIAFCFPLMMLQFEFEEILDNEKSILDVLKFLILPVIIVFPPFAVFSGFIIMISELMKKDIVFMIIAVVAIFFSSISVLAKNRNIANSKIGYKKDYLTFLSLIAATIILAVFQTKIFAVIFSFANQVIAELG
ncbi:MAG: hypothetical protein AB7U85_05710 [Alphaproteobacteria bacterium]